MRNSGVVSFLLLVLIVALVGGGPHAALAQAPAYVIGPEDVLDIQVWDNKDLNQTVFVRPDGRISLPLLGELEAAGKTVQKLQEDLTELYAKSVKVPSVTVIVKEIKSRPVYFIGGFGKPGVQQLTRDLNLIQAVALVSGIAAAADPEKGYVLRGEKRIPVDFTKLMQRGDVSHNIRLEPGDSVVIPVADNVFVEGEVKKPGAVKYTNDLTIVKAVVQAGGVTPLAATGRVDLLRTEGEKKVRIRVDLDKIMRAPDENQDVKLRPDDIILVPQRLF